MCIFATDGLVVRGGISVNEMYFRDLEVMSSNPGQVELGVLSTTKSYLIQIYFMQQQQIYISERCSLVNNFLWKYSLLEFINIILNTYVGFIPFFFTPDYHIFCL